MEQSIDGAKKCLLHLGYNLEDPDDSIAKYEMISSEIGFTRNGEYPEKMLKNKMSSCATKLVEKEKIIIETFYGISHRYEKGYKIDDNKLYDIYKYWVYIIYKLLTNSNITYDMLQTSQFFLIFSRFIMTITFHLGHITLDTEYLRKYFIDIIINIVNCHFNKEIIKYMCDSEATTYTCGRGFVNNVENKQIYISQTNSVYDDLIKYSDYEISELEEKINDDINKNKKLFGSRVACECLPNIIEKQKAGYHYKYMKYKQKYMQTKI